LVACCVHDPFAKSRAMYLRQGKTARNALCLQPALAYFTTDFDFTIVHNNT